MADNANPVVHEVGAKAARLDLFDTEHDEWLSSYATGSSSSEDEEDLIDANEVFDLIRSIHDPEHPLSLEQLAVVSPEQITVTHGKRPTISVDFTPTISHCSLASLIGLSLRVRLLRALPERFKVDIRVRKGSHESENSLNKQLNDKERVAAALENTHLLGVVQQCLEFADLRGRPAEVSA